MIKATIYRLQDTSILGFELSGHAESGPHGHDLVCAAVSAVAFGMTNAVIKHSQLQPIISQGDSGGYFKVLLPETDDQQSLFAAKLLLEGMVTSLETIAHDYSAYISIVEEKGGKNR